MENNAYNGNYRSIDEIKTANREAGFSFFTDGSADLFGRRVNEAIYFGKYIITSQRISKGSRVRLFTARVAAPSGEVTTIGEFNGHATSAEAKKYIRLHHDAAVSMLRRETFWLFGDDPMRSMKATIIEHPRTDGWERVSFEIEGKSYCYWPINVLAMIHGERILNPL